MAHTSRYCAVKCINRDVDSDNANDPPLTMLIDLATVTMSIL